MSGTSSAGSDKFAKAVTILKRAPTLTVREAMLAAEFTPSEASTKVMQRKVTRALPGKTKRKFNNVLSSIETNSDTSPLSDLSSSINGNDLEPSPPRKLKKQRLNSQQMQDKRENDLYLKNRQSKAHKAATLLYDNERRKENGLSLRAVERVIKKSTGVLDPAPRQSTATSSN